MLLDVQDLRKAYGGEIVLDRVSFRIEQGDKVALVGRNGCGKTTLIRLLVGEEEPDGGRIVRARGLRLGYLRQIDPLGEALTVRQAAEQARAELIALRDRMEALARQLDGNPSDEDLAEYARLAEHFAAEGGYAVENELTVVLRRMGFDECEFDKPVGALSGGERTRLGIARLLLEEPDLLILDEPTNHLDLEATEWLEGWLRSYRGAVLFVSHDRRFLEAVARRVLELADGRVTAYPGPFEKYLALRAEARRRAADLAALQQAEIERLEDYVRRFINSQRTAQARGRLKRLEKLRAQALRAPGNVPDMRARFGPVRRSGDLALEVEGLSVRYGNRTLLHGLNWKVRWGERWGVIGANGAGKSTLARCLLGLVEPSAGRVRLGANVDVGYFAQDAGTLPPDRTPVEILGDLVGLREEEARKLLGRFLLSGEDALRPVRTLSGGERNKLQLALLAYQAPNLLVLDEPTNHLDRESREKLAEALSEYAGTLILVSHDRWLLETTTDFTLDVRADGCVVFPGSFDEYAAHRRTAATAPRPDPPRASSGAGPDSAAAGPPPLSPRELSKEIARLQKEVRKAEERVHELEAALRDLQDSMMRPEADHRALSERYRDVEAELDAALRAWADLAEELDAREAQRRATDGVHPRLKTDPVIMSKETPGRPD